MQDPPLSTVPRPRAFYAGLFLVTAATLILQVVQTRILSVVAWYHLAFFVITIAMFGLTAGAVWVYLRGRRISVENYAAYLARHSTFFALSCVLGLFVQMTLATTITFDFTALVAWFELALCIAAPFFFSGVVVSVALTRTPFPISRVYGVDLAGAAAGCLGSLLLLSATDGPSAVLWVAALAALAAALFSRGMQARASSPSWLLRMIDRPERIAVLLAVAALANGMTLRGLRPAVVKSAIENHGGLPIFERWNTFSRITVRGGGAPTKPTLWGPSPKQPVLARVEQRHLTIDGGAATSMFRFDGNLEQASFLKQDVTNLAYFLPERRSGAVIGVGGGRDVLSAKVFGVDMVTGVEVNPIFIDLLTRDANFRDFAGIDQLPNVTLVVDEGRSWFVRSGSSFDVLQMSMIDTWAATGAGAFTLSENGLYTLEAWRTFFRRLSPTGVFTVSRWYRVGKAEETGRMISLALATLLSEGISQPDQHVYVASAGNIATLVLARSVFDPRHLVALDEACRYYGYEILISPTRKPDSPMLAQLFEFDSVEALRKHTRTLPLDLSAPTDDRPFFFNQLPFDRPLETLKLVKQYTEGGVVGGNLLAAFTLVAIIFISAVLVATTILLPLRGAVRDVGRKLVVNGTTYFLLIGLGFMCVEIALLQRMSVFLGHPVYSLSLVLFGLILATGLGSFVTERLPLTSPSRFALWAALLGGYLMSIPFWISPLLLSFESATLFTRAVVCVAVIAPAGVMMGFAFPTGMKLVAKADDRPTPWFWGVNGAAGVLAGSLAVGTSIAFGINTSLIVGACCYVLLIPAAFGLIRIPHSSFNGRAHSSDADAELRTESP